MAGKMRVPRSRGALSGALLVLAGLVGGLLPFVGPYFNFAFTPDEPWVWTANRFWLSVLPAIATVLGGLILLFSANRLIAMLGGWLAALGGIWFIVGGAVSRLWTSGGAPGTGTPIGGRTRQVFEQLAFFEGLGALILLLSALALGRLAVVGVKEARMAAERHGQHERPATEPEPEPHGRRTRTEEPEPQHGRHEENWMDRVRHKVHL